MNGIAQTAIFKLMSVLTKHRFSVTEYYKMGKTGVLRPDARVELLDAIGTDAGHQMYPTLFAPGSLGLITFCMR